MVENLIEMIALTSNHLDPEELFSTIFLQQLLKQNIC